MSTNPDAGEGHPYREAPAETPNRRTRPAQWALDAAVRLMQGFVSGRGVDTAWMSRATWQLAEHLEDEGELRYGPPARCGKRAWTDHILTCLLEAGHPGNCGLNP